MLLFGVGGGNLSARQWPGKENRDRSKRGFVMRGTKISFGAKLIVMYAVLVVLLAQTGCVERKLTINTVPVGALVWLNDEEIGAAPVTVDFNWYGDYKVRISKEGYETLDTHRKLKAPLHDAPILDFFAEVIWPGQILDEYEWTFQLAPYRPPQRAELLNAARQMRTTANVELPEAVGRQAEDQQSTANE